MLPVQDLKAAQELTQAFVNLQQNEQSIKAHYQKFMPTYINRAYEAAQEIKKLLN